MEIGLGEDFGGGAEGDGEVVEEEGLVEEGGGGAEVVMGGDDEAAFLGEFVDEGTEGLGGGLVEAGEGLVEEEDVGFLRDGAGEEGALLLAAGEFVDLAMV